MTETMSDQNERERYVKAFGAMVLSRTLDRKIITAQRQGRVGFYTPSMGQEAGQIGLSMALEKDDLMFQYYRDVALMIHKGVPVENIINQVMGNSEDNAKGRQMPSHFLADENNFMSVQSPVASNLPLAVGAAYGVKLRKEDKIVVASFGEGSSSTPDFHAALNMAAVMNLPVLFFCENNGWAISLPFEKQTKVDVYKKADAYGIRGTFADGNNIEESYKAAKEAVDYVRAGNGPALLEVKFFRMGPHSTSDDPTKYQSDIVKEGEDRDPVVINEKLLKEKGYLTDEQIEKIKEESTRYVNEKFDECEKIEPPAPETLFEDVYEKMPWNIREEMEEIL